MGKAFIIGRKSAGKANILLDDTTVSGQHACLAVRSDGYFLSDAGSTNGTYVQRAGQMLKVKDDIRLEDTDILHFGDYVLSLSELVSMSKRPVSVNPPHQSVTSDTQQRVRCQTCGAVVPKSDRCETCNAPIYS